MLVPDYNSGNEVLALEAAGATVRYYAVGPDGQADPAEVERLCAAHQPDVLYVIHYLGWPQPVQQFAAVCRERGMWMVEDCALALLSDAQTQPLGTFGHWSIFCLYKTLPLPNGACLVQNSQRLEPLERLGLRHAGLPSVLGQTAELMVRGIRSRADGLGAAVQSMTRAWDCRRRARSCRPTAARSKCRAKSAAARNSPSACPPRQIPSSRSRRMNEQPSVPLANLDGRVNALHSDLPDGVCPLFFPILVDDKRSTAALLKERGVDALQFWNYGARHAEAREASEGGHSSFLRKHVLGLPIHQDLTARHISHVAEQVRRVNLRMS